MSAPATTLSEWARVAAVSLRQAGVRVVVASPGSRSTPYLAALLQAGLEVVDVVDERAAAFAALGAARASGEPAAVLCTSGTAPAHWLPAVVEASLARVPMVLLSADRPTELSLCGAPQTVDQVKLFGAQVRFFVDPGNPEPDERALAGLRRAVAQAVSCARGPDPGPVHVNLRARKPLEPREPSTPEEHALRRVADALLARPLPRALSRVEAHPAEVELAAARLAASERPLFVAGPLPVGVDASALVSLVERAGGVLFAELTSQLRFVPGARRFDTFDEWVGAGLFAGSLDEPPAPDLVVQLGGAPTSAVYERWLATHRPARLVLGVPDWNDPHASAEQIVRGELDPIARALASRLREAAPAPTGWAEQLAALDREGRALLDAASDEWGEPAVARTVVASLPAGARLVVGNSLPIRMLDRHGARPLRATPIEALHQRGANGIDGLVAQSFGATLAAPRPTAALLGDVTLLHDVGALSVARRARAPLAIVVVANGGGRIFETLPVAREAPWMMPHVVTEEPLDHRALAAAFGLAHHRVESAPALATALATALERPGCTLVEAVVPPHGAAATGARIRECFAAALTARRPRSQP